MTTNPTTKPNDSAFPTYEGPAYLSDLQDAGLTNREYFAARALQGLLSNLARFGTADEIAILAVGFADALIEALNKEEAV